MENIELNLSLEEINAVLEALGQLPFVRVHTLIAKIQQQATAQLQQEHNPAAIKNNHGEKPSKE